MVDAPLTLHWLPFDAYFPNKTMIISVSVLPNKVAKMLFMDISKQDASQITNSKTPHRESSFEVYFPNGAVTVSLSDMPINVDHKLAMDNSKRIAAQFTYLQNQESLMLHWPWFSEWHCDHVAVSIAYSVCQYIGYGKQRANHYAINFLIRPKIVDAALTLIFWMGLLPCCVLLGLSRLLIYWVWITASELLPTYVAYKSKNHWHSVDAYFLNGAVTVLLSL